MRTTHNLALQKLASDNLDFTFGPCNCLICQGGGGKNPIATGIVDTVPGTGTTGIPLPGNGADGWISPANDVDRYSLNVVAGQTYLVSMVGAGATPLRDSFLVLRNAGLGVVNTDDDGGSGTNSLLTFTAAYTGVYYVDARSFAGSGQYRLDVREQTGPDVTDDPALAVSLTPGTITFGFIEQNRAGPYAGLGEVDTYKLSTTDGLLYTIEVAGGADYASNYLALPPGELDNIVVIYREDGTVVASNDDIYFGGGDIGSGVSFIGDGGVYYVDVLSYRPWTGGYTITTKEIDLSGLSPLDSIDWFSSDNIDTVNVNGVPTAYVYFGAAGEHFGETTDGTTPITTFGWNDREKTQVMLALQEFTEITGIQYLETTDINQAEFRLNTVNTGNFGAYFYPQDPDFGTQQGIGIFNVNSGGWDKPGVSTQNLPGDQVSLDQGGFSFAVILHEFGHAHGLSHPHDNGGGSDIVAGVFGPFDSYGAYDLNQGVYTVMSYNDAWPLHPDGPSPFTIAGIDNGWSGTLSAFDIAVLQQRYGVHAYNAGNNTYALTDVVNDAFYQTIWDSSGIDTISYGGALNATIDLTAATLDYSPTGGGVLSYLRNPPGTPAPLEVQGGYTIANGVVIENATGGGGNDVLIGNGAANALTGNAGNDVLLGRDGSDLLSGGDGDDVLNGGAGKNELIGGAGNDIFVFEDSGAKDKIRDFDSGNDLIDLTAFGIDRGDVKITGGNVFADTDGVKGYDLHIVVQGDKVQMSDILFASPTGSSSAAMGGGLQVEQMLIV